MSGLQNENSLHTNDSRTLVVYVKPGKSIKDWCFVHLLNRLLFVFAQLKSQNLCIYCVRALLSLGGAFDMKHLLFCTARIIDENLLLPFL